jgi:hypothetical protein
MVVTGVDLTYSSPRFDVFGVETSKWRRSTLLPSKFWVNKGIKVRLEIRIRVRLLSFDDV